MSPYEIFLRPLLRGIVLGLAAVAVAAVPPLLFALATALVG